MSTHRDRTTPRTGVAAAALTAIVLLAAACGGANGPGVAGAGPSSTGRSSSPSSSVSNGPLAFSQCMRSHGVHTFPDPDRNGTIQKKSPQQLGVSDSRYKTAVSACAHLLNSGSGRLRQQKLNFALAIARCVRAHGFPTFPDPGPHGESNWNHDDEKSPRFQAAEKLCEARARRELHIPSSSATKGGS